MRRISNPKQNRELDHYDALIQNLWLRAWTITTNRLGVPTFVFIFYHAKYMVRVEESFQVCSWDGTQRVIAENIHLEPIEKPYVIVHFEHFNIA